MAVHLKGNFDKYLKDAFDILLTIDTMIVHERARPTKWSGAQLEDLTNIHNAVAQLAGAVSEMANQVRDD
jgi:hypothetical protein